MYFSRKKIFLYVFLTLFLAEFLCLVNFLRTDFFRHFLASIDPNFLVELTNQDRELIGRILLQNDFILEQAAYLKAKDMAENGYFAHTSPDGITPWYWFEKVGYEFSHAGENLAVNFSDSEKLHEAWINSPTHKANIISNNFTRIGIAKATGIYKGREATFVVQLFARPKQIQTVLVEQEQVETIAPAVEEVISQPRTEVLSEELAKAQEPIKDDNYESFVSVVKTEDDEISPIFSSSLTEREELRYTPLLNRITSLFSGTAGYLLFLGIVFLIILGLEIIAGTQMRFYETIASSTLILLVAGFTLYLNSLLIAIINARIQLL